MASRLPATRGSIGLCIEGLKDSGWGIGGNAAWTEAVFELSKPCLEGLETAGCGAWCNAVVASAASPSAEAAHGNAPVAFALLIAAGYAGLSRLCLSRVGR